MGKINRLGRTSVSVARTHEQVGIDIQTLTGLTVYRVKKALANARGNTLVRNLFATQWPTTETFRKFTVKDARDNELWEELSEITGLSQPRVRALLRSEHGGRLLGNVFAKHWPDLPDDNGGARRTSKTSTRADDDFGDLVDDDDDDDTDDDDNLGDSEEDEQETLHVAEFGLQGGPEHRAIQLMLCQIGKIKEYHVKTNYDIGAGVKPDVLWFRLEPERSGGAALVIEIERGTAAALQKSLASLKHAHDRYPGAHLRLIVPKARLAAVELRLGGMFHEIQRTLRTHAIEDCKSLDIYALATKLELLKM